MAESENSVEETTTHTLPPKSINHTQISLRYDSRYVRKKGGVAKLVELILSFSGFVSIQCTYLAMHSTGKWFSTVSMCGVWITGILMFFYLFHFVEKFNKIPWIKFELFYCIIIALCYLIGSVMAVSIESDAYQAAAFFGFLAAIVYGFDAYAKYLWLKSGEPAQGEKEVSKETAANTSPT